MGIKKLLIANRGEIGTRIVRTCREMGIGTVALYEASDRGSLHVRLADQCVQLRSSLGFLDGDAVLEIARETGADAIHPGYGFLAEEASFIRACRAAGLVFVGPPAAVVSGVRNKIDALERARSAGFQTVLHSTRTFAPDELYELQLAAEGIGYPLVIKSCRGGRGAGERLVMRPQKLEMAVHQAQAEAQAVYGDQRVYLEKAILPAQQIGVQILADSDGRAIHLGEREGSAQRRSQKIVEEAPAPSLDQGQRATLWQTALRLARFFNCENAVTVEFLVDERGVAYFTEIKARIQVDHPLVEMTSGVDLIEQQIRLAAGGPLLLEQEAVLPRGWAMLGRLRATDPMNHFLPSPGQVGRVRWPQGPGVRVDSYIYGGCRVPGRYDPLIAKITAWHGDRQSCLQRFRRSLEEVKLRGVASNLSLLQRIAESSPFALGQYTTSLLDGQLAGGVTDERLLADLAVAAAVLYVHRNQRFTPSLPDRLLSGWHRESRRLAE